MPETNRRSHEKENNNKDPEISICLDIIRVLIKKHGVDPSRDSTDEDGCAQTVFRDFATVFFQRNQWPPSLRSLRKYYQSVEAIQIEGGLYMT